MKKMTSNETTDFGFKKILTEEKTRKVAEIFSSVASDYDLMNDLMSFGIHRRWKKLTVHLSGVRKGQHVLDVAGGTGDMSLLFHQCVGDSGTVTVTDINSDMLKLGRKKFIDKGIIKGISYIQGNAENLPFKNNSFDCISIAFGLRNVADKQKSLRSMYEKIKYGGCLVILEFSNVVSPQLKKLYDAYSFKLIPWIGRKVAKSEDSYRYLVESIRMHPDQQTLKTMIEEAGFSQVSYYNFSGGIVALHKAYKI